jgi:hypothetical protein
MKGGIHGQVVGLSSLVCGFDSNIPELRFLAMDHHKAIYRQEILFGRCQSIQHMCIGDLVQVKGQAEVLTGICPTFPGGQNQVFASI